MKRDMDLIRSIMLWIEAQPEGHNWGWKIAIDGHTDEEIGFHVHLLGQAGLLAVAEATSSDSTSPSAVPISITWTGFEFIEAAKDDTVWAKVRKKVLTPAGGVAFKLLAEWLLVEGKNRLGLPH